MKASVFALLLSATSAEPCCKTCQDGYEKYYSVPKPNDANPECGECCLQPSRFNFWKIFEPALAKGDCGTQGFTKYSSTETDGVGPASVTNDRYFREVSTEKSFCPSKLKAVYADIHDGDKKEVTIEGTALTIKPSGNDETWVVNAKLDADSCSATIDFNVPGKPGPPPVNLTATLWWSVSASQKKTEFEFTDPSGTLADMDFPLNRWVELGKSLDASSAKSYCPKKWSAVYADMHDGDKKEVTIEGSALTIKPSGNNQTWVVNAELDAVSCKASIDFNVPGKPGPPPVSLTATLWRQYSGSASEKKTEFEFTDPSGTLADATFPLNHWVEIGKKAAELTV